MRGTFGHINCTQINLGGIKELATGAFEDQPKLKHLDILNNELDKI